MIVAFDTSALIKLVVDEPESAALESFVGGLEPRDVGVISALAVTELRRVCIRVGIDPAVGMALVGGFEVIRLSQGVLEVAGLYPHRHLGTLDAIHLATAATIGADTLVTYDRQLADATRAEGLLVHSPGWDA